MRCKNCGWINPADSQNCEKCHATLQDENFGIIQNPTHPVSDRMKSTVAEGVIFTELEPVVISCPKCGYPLSENTNCCPNCNYEVKSDLAERQCLKCRTCGQKVNAESKFCPECGVPLKEDVKPRRIQRSNMGTVIGGPMTSGLGDNKFCTLKPIAWEGEAINYNPVTYTGETIILNRANTDANNNSITSREQAILTCEEGEWYIENRSELRTTFIRVNGKIKLSDGDIIVLGNREFEFRG